MNRGELLVCADPRALAATAAAMFVSFLHEAIAERGVARVALSGGSTPRAMFEVLATMQVPWTDTEVFWVDERAVPASSDRSNYGAASAALFSKLSSPPRGLHPMPGDAPSLPDAAAGYSATLAASLGVSPEGAAPALDVVWLGIGDDGHTASLFPGDGAVTATDRWVLDVPAHEGREARLTLSRAVIAAARRVVVLAQGASKRGPIARARTRGDEGETPARVIGAATGQVIWLVDEAARPLDEALV